MRPKISILLTCGVVILSLAGCSDEEGKGRIDPVQAWLHIIPGSATVEVGNSIGVEALVCGGCATDITWYVNHISGGSSEVGTITQSNPAIYRAPDRRPARA